MVIEIDKEKETFTDTFLIQCAACGHMGTINDFYNSCVHNNFKICPTCGTVRYVCAGNIGFRK